MSTFRERRRQARRRERIAFASGAVSFALLVLLWSMTRCIAVPPLDGLLTGTSPAPPTVVESPTPVVPTPTPPISSLTVGVNIPGAVRAEIENVSRERGWTIVGPNEKADLVIGDEPADGALALTEKVYAVVASFSALRDEMTSGELRNLWQGQAAISVSSLYASKEDDAPLTSVLGAPGARVRFIKADAMTARLWGDPRALGIVPFDELNIKESALLLDGLNVLSREEVMDRYALVARTWVKGDAGHAQSFIAALRSRIPATNRNTERMTTLIMTGSSALARGTAARMEQVKDPGYPARKIAPVLSRADITHASNEVPFVENCKANDTTGLITFCSHPSYVETYKLIGTKIVGLTGNHVLDYGTQNFVKTLDLYDQLGLRYYGGGRNSSDAAKPLFLTDHGNRLAFLGANSFGPASIWAKPDRPGALAYDADSMAQQIAAAHRQADVISVEMQADETYEYKPNLNNMRLFRRLSEVGADMVTGVQSHQPQAVEFSEDGKRIIFYGLGNLFFDQEFSEAVRQGLIARHTIYRGRLMQTEILTTMLEERAQPRFATRVERERILRAVFAASGFKLP